MILAFIGKSASGKDTLVNAIKKLYDSPEMRSVATRQMRPGEINGEKYFFISKESFDELRKRGELAEEVHYNGNAYGITKDEVRRCAKSSQFCTLVAVPKGVDDIENVCGKGSVFRVYVHCDDEIRRQRFLDRIGRTPTEKELSELEERMKGDEEVFRQAIDQCDLAIDTTDNELMTNPKSVVRQVISEARKFFVSQEETFEEDLEEDEQELWNDAVYELSCELIKTTDVGHEVLGGDIDEAFERYLGTLEDNIVPLVYNEARKAVSEVELTSEDASVYFHAKDRNGDFGFKTIAMKRFVEKLEDMDFVKEAREDFAEIVEEVETEHDRDR